MDMLNPMTPLQLRGELDRLVRQDLLGPAGGEREEIEEANVRGRYIVGLLAPKGQTLLPDDAEPCEHKMRTLTLGASNTWFPVVIVRWLSLLTVVDCLNWWPIIGRLCKM